MQNILKICQPAAKQAEYALILVQSPSNIPKWDRSLKKTQSRKLTLGTSKINITLTHSLFLIRDKLLNTSSAQQNRCSDSKLGWNQLLLSTGSMVRK